MSQSTATAHYGYADLADLPIKKSLRPIAKGLYIKGYSRMNKDVIVAAILDAQPQMSASMENEETVAATVSSIALEAPPQPTSQQPALIEVATSDDTRLINPWDEHTQEVEETNIAKAAIPVVHQPTDSAALPMLLIAIFAMVILWATAQVLIMTGQAVATLLNWFVQLIEDKRKLLAKKVAQEEISAHLAPLVAAMGCS